MKWSPSFGCNSRPKRYDTVHRDVFRVCGREPYLFKRFQTSDFEYVRDQTRIGMTKQMRECGW
jgi:hypothetical protein